MIKLTRLIKSFKYAFKGFLKVFIEEQNLQIHLFVGLMVVVFGFFLKISYIEWVLLILVIGLVILTEIINSVIERICDVLKPRIDSYVKEIKDIAAAIVMLASIIAVLVGVIIFYPYIF